jgi:hypothetical protein
MFNSLPYESQMWDVSWRPVIKKGNGLDVNLKAGATRLSKPEIDSVGENQLMPFLLSTTSLPARWAAGVRTLVSSALLSHVLLKGKSCQSQRTEQSRVVAECSFRNDQVIQIMRMEYMLFQTLLEGQE